MCMALCICYQFRRFHRIRNIEVIILQCELFKLIDPGVEGRWRQTIYKIEVIFRLRCRIKQIICICDSLFWPGLVD